MRRFFVCLGLAGLLLGSATDANAQKAFSSKEVSERINVLRTRLQAYQLKSVRKVIDKTPLDNETVEIKSEKAFVELDSRPGAALTVLFHDSELPGNSAAQSASSMVVATAGTPGVNQQPSAINEEQRLRNERFDALRQKVQLATRRAHSAAKTINSQMASLEKK